MLKLLLKNRIRYYRNYLKYHLDTVTVIELGLILLVFLFLLARSPADIGYNLKWFFTAEFHHAYIKIFFLLLPVFYFISEFFAWLTLRPSSEWFILGGLPFHRNAVSNYYLFRHSSKIFTLIIVGAIAFFGGSDPFYFRLIKFFEGLGLLSSLQLVSFLQAQNIRNPHRHNLKGYIRWFFAELLVIGSLLIIAPYMRLAFAAPLSFFYIGFLLPWILIVIFYNLIQKHFVPYISDGKVDRKSIHKQKYFYSDLFSKLKGPKTAFIFRDILFLWRIKRSTFYLFVFAVLLLALICIIMEEVFAVYITILSLQILISLLLIKTVVLLFQNDVDGYELIRILPIKTGSFWLSRWLFIFGFLSSPIVVPTLIIPIIFKITIGYIAFALIGLFGIPLIMATLYCNSGFGLFPHVHLTGYMITISILFIVLFWFFMPFGSIIILAVILFWVRKSQKRFQFLELL